MFETSAAVEVVGGDPRVTDILGRDGLIEPSPQADTDAPVGDLTREPLDFLANRDLRLQVIRRGPTRALPLLSWLFSQRGCNHPFAGEIRFRRGRGWYSWPRMSASWCRSARSFHQNARWSTSQGSATEALCFYARIRTAFGQSEQDCVDGGIGTLRARARRYRRSPRTRSS